MPSSTSGWPTFASFVGDAEVARHRDLEAAAERVAVNRGDERLGRILEPLQQRVRAGRSFERLLARLQRLEDLDVGAGDERRPAPIRTIASAAGIADGARDRLVDAFVHTAGLSALTGGLSIVTTATRSRTS